MNLRVKWNTNECENFDYMLRHNRTYNNLIISKFDRDVGKECDVCEVGVETCMHEFVECGELRLYFGDFVVKMEWRKLWLFGVKERKKGCNINLLNYVLSHARYAVKLRRNIAHYEKKKSDVWNVFKNLTERDVRLTRSYIG